MSAGTFSDDPQLQEILRVLERAYDCRKAGDRPDDRHRQAHLKSVVVLATKMVAELERKLGNK